jgi:sulfoxide reductase heme-binding subunit YedZ
VTALVGSQAYWYATRGTGLVVLVLLSASVVLGALESAGWSSPRWPRIVVAGLHRNVTLISLGLLGVHIATAVRDGFAPISWLDAVVPFHSRYRPIWLGFGALAFDLLVALVLTSLVRHRLGYRSWKALHWTAYACWPLAVVHAFGTGTDTRLGWVLATEAACLAAVAASLASRLWQLVRQRPAGLAAAGTGMLVSLVALVAWLASGPLRPGWPRAAGTPTSLLGQAAAQAPATTPELRAQVSGTLSQAPAGEGLLHVRLDCTMSGGAGTLRVDLFGPPEGGGVELVSSRVVMSLSSPPATYRGSVTTLDGGRLDATLSAGSSSVELHADLSVDQAQGTVEGTVEVSQPGGRG